MKRIIFTALLFCCLCQTSYGFAREHQWTTTVSYIPASEGFPIVQLRLNDKLTANFVIDTGTTGSMMTEDIASRLGLAPTALPAGHGKPYKATDLVGMVTVARIGLGQLVLPSIALLVARRQGLLSSFEEPIDGIIGMNILSQFAVSFDFQKHEITFWFPGHLDEEARKRAGLAGSSAISITISNEKYRCLCPIRINDKIVNCAIDTGKWNSILSARLAKQLQLLPLERGVKIYLEGSRTVDKAHLESVQLGNLNIHHLIVQFPQSEDIDDQAILGLDVLSGYHVLIDMPQKAIYLEPAIRQTVSIPFELSDESIPLLPVVFKDGKTRNFALGKYHESIIDRPVAQDLGWSPVSASNTPTKRHTTVQDVTLGVSGLKLDKVSFYVSDLGDVRKKMPDLAGYLGFDLLGLYALRLDASKNRLDFISPGFLAGTQFVPSGAYYLPLIWTNGGYAVPGMVDTTSTSFIIDPNFPYTTIGSRPLLATLKSAASLEWSDGVERVRYLRLEKIVVGGVTWKDVVVMMGKSATNQDVNVLGWDFLSQFHPILDLPAQAMYLEPASAYQKEDLNTVGLGILPFKISNGKQIIGVLATPSPAQEAGLQQGDEILEINGLSAQRMTQEELSDQMDKPEDTVIQLKIRRKGENTPRTYRLKVRKLL